MASLDALFQQLQPRRLTAAVDVGANPIDGEPRYKAMLQKGICTLVGFEPQADAFDLLQRNKGPRETYLSYIISDGSPQTLYSCQASGMTSLFKPDPNVLALF